MRRAWTFTFGLALASPLAGQSMPLADAVRPVVDSLARDFLARNQSPSVAIGLVRGRDTIALQAWGMADLEQNVAASARTVYRIGSVTKQFTAALVMQLVDQGKVKLDDSIAAYIPGLPSSWQPVTIRQLLNHTSGIPSYTDLGPAWRRRWGEEMPPDTIIALTFPDTMWFKPGTAWRYDNTGYILLGMLVETVTGRSWGENLQERLAGPLALHDTRECLNQPLIMRRARGYERADAEHWENTAYLAMSQPYAAGAMCSTVGDLARWNRALHTGQVVSASAYRRMTTAEGAAKEADLHYGFGLIADTIAGRAMITHGGGIHGFISANAWIPSAELSVTVLTNSGSAGSTGDLMKQLVRAALGQPLETPPGVVAIGPEARKHFVGVYALELPGETRDFVVAEAGDHLTGQLEGQPSVPLIYYGKNAFGVGFDPRLRLVFTVEGNRGTSVTLYQGGGTFIGKRK